MNVEECSVCEPNLALILHQKFNRFFLRNSFDFQNGCMIAKIYPLCISCMSK